ncbi:MAG: peptide/nickel transport system ATP-binding protein [Paracoccaceae bacterium]|jgi:peptide/nickel transport system ATP-binding protein
MIQIEGLSLRIHDTPILRNVTIEMTPGQIFGLVGESGSGKSMTALSLMQLLPDDALTSGRALLDGIDLLTRPEAQMCTLRGNELSMIFQEPMTALNPVQTIGNQVAETLLIHGATNRSEARKIARDKLDRVGLQTIALDRYPHELSGGQRQRVCIAMAIALRPRLLIADEPTTALDVTTQAQILSLLRDLVHEDGMALLLITHDLAVVAETADHVAVMRRGEIVEQGPTAQILAQRKHPYTQALFAASSHVPIRPAQAQDTPLLQVNQVIRSYPGRLNGFKRAAPVRAVDRVSLTLNKGESLGLVGESGCGKSTLIRAILGLEPVQGGEIKLFGHTVGPDLPNSARAGIQVVFQDPYGSFNPRWRVERLVAEPFYLLPTPLSPIERRERVAEALISVGLTASDLDKYPHEFSGGQRQRIAIARALITKPDILVLDEAVSALDVSIRAQILDLLADLQGRLGLSYLFISHDLTVVRAITDRVLVMQAGQIVEHGPTEQVFTNPQHSYTKILLAAAPLLPDAQKGMSHEALV